MPPSSHGRQETSPPICRSRRTKAHSKHTGTPKSPKRLVVSRSYPTQKSSNNPPGYKRSRNRTQPVQYKSPRNSRRKHNDNKPHRKSRHKEATASRANVGSNKSEKIVSIYTTMAKGKRSISYVARPKIKTGNFRGASPKR